MQVELAHGGRGPSSSSDRRSGYSGGGGGGGSGGGSAGRFGISRHSEFRGATKAYCTYHMHECSLFSPSLQLIVGCLIIRNSFDCTFISLCSYCSWASIVCFMARLEGQYGYYIFISEK